MAIDYQNSYKEIPREALLSCRDISHFLLLWFTYMPLQENVDAFKRYYRNFLKNFGPRMQQFYRTQSQYVQDAILQKKAPSVLDVGCGCGTESLWLTLMGANVLGVDITKDNLNVALERQNIMEHTLGGKIKCRFELKSVLDLDPSDKKFDIIWMEQAFHHVEPREELLLLLPKLLKDDGILIISESNAWNPLIQIGLLKFRGFRTILFYPEPDGTIKMWGHERILTQYSLTKHLKQHGLTVIRSKYFRLLPSNKKFDHLAWMESIWPQFLFPAFTHYNVVAQKTKNQ